MNCPVCKTTDLKSVRLEDTLKAQHCSGCEGHWLTHAHYDTWRSHQPAELSEQPFAEIELEAQDVANAKICPSCNRLMGKFKVGHGMNFYLDRCSCCGGVWMDQNEWAVLKSHNLHDKVHRIFSTQWERENRMADIATKMDTVYNDRFGDDDYLEIKRVREWLTGHPHQQQLIAFLKDEDPYTL